MPGTRVTRRRFLATTAASTTLVAAPYVRRAHAAGTLSVGLWDHWVPGANDVMQKQVNAWANKNKVDVQLDTANPDPNALDPQRIAVQLNSGARHEIHLPHTYGHPDAALSVSENLAKFRRCANLGRKPLPASSVERLIEMVAAIERLDDVAGLVGATLA